MTYKQVVAKSACPVCGAPVGTMCGAGAGRLRREPHPERRRSASGRRVKQAGSALGNMLARFGIGKKSA